MFFVIFSDHSFALLALVYTLLYFEHQVFLVFDDFFSFYHKDTKRNQNNVVNGRNIVPLLSPIF